MMLGSKLNKQVESGSMKLVDERKALQEISSLRRVRKTVEAFQTEQDGIDADRAKLDELRKQLDDPELKAASDRYETIKTELDAIKKDSDTAVSLMTDTHLNSVCANVPILHLTSSSRDEANSLTNDQLSRRSLTVYGPRRKRRRKHIAINRMPTTRRCKKTAPSERRSTRQWSPPKNRIRSAG